MTHPQLRLAAAKFALGLATITDLVDASHAALNDAVYADGLAVIATTPNMPMWEATPHFASALRELDHTFASQDNALSYLRLSYFGPVAEGEANPLGWLEAYYSDVHDPLRGVPLRHLEGWDNPSAWELVDHHLDRELRWSVNNAQLSAMNPVQLECDWKERAIELCRDWCREYARLYQQPAWRSPTVLALASAIHAENAFDRLPVLADALEEAGCDHPDLLGHCRHDTPHTDYCWLVDALNGVPRQGEPGV